MESQKGLKKSLSTLSSLPTIGMMNQIPSPYQAPLRWIAAQHTQMLRLLEQWTAISSQSDNIHGLDEMRGALRMAFAVLPGEVREISLPPQQRVNAEGAVTLTPLGKALSITKKGGGPLSVLLGGHMDTVHREPGALQRGDPSDSNRWRGPGAADMKGGLVVLLTALRAFENSPFAKQLGWEILMNPDEEIGSTGSASLFREAAKRNQAALLFEPSFPDGAFVSARKGSAVYSLVVRGRAAHAGRDISAGRNAIMALLPVIQKLGELRDDQTGTSLNIGHIIGGGQVNIVPDLAILRFGVRALDATALANVCGQIKRIALEGNEATEGISMVLHQTSYRPPKPFTAKNQQFYRSIQRCAASLNLPMEWRETGGVCDGNILAAEGLPTLDTLGPIGGDLHTSHEYLLADSLVPRAQLTALILMQIAEGTLPIPKE